MTVERKWAHLVVLLVVGSLIFAACGPTPEPQVVEKVVTQVVKETVKETVVVAGTPQIVEKEVTKVVEVQQVVTATPPPVEEAPTQLVIAQPSDPTTLDPQKCSGLVGANINHNMYDALTTIDIEGKLVPGLALSWEALSDTQWRFKLREGVEFHNGELFDAQSAKFTIDRLLSQAERRCWDFTGIFDRTEVVDDYTLDVFTKFPTPLVPFMASVVFALPPVHGSKMGEDFGREPVGTGPFKFVEWLPNERVVLEANESYWGGKPPVQTLIFKPVPEVTTRVAELDTGNADIAVQLTNEATKILEGSDLTRVVSVPGARVFEYIFNLLPEGPEYLKDKRVRQALNYAIDKQSIIDSVLGGHAFARGTIWRPDYFGYDPSYGPIPYDPDKARQLLAEAGYPDGFETTMFATPFHPGGVEIAQAIENQLMEVGVKADLEIMDWGVYRDFIISHEKNPQGMWAWHWGNDYPDPDEVLDGLFGCGAISSYLCDPDYDALVEAERKELDPERRAVILRDIQAYMQENPPALWLWQWADIYGVSSRLEWTPRFDQVIKAMEIGFVE